MDEDWRDRDPDALRAAACAEVPLIEGATHCFVSATITRSDRHPLGRLLGDTLVLVPSASGRSRTRRIPFDEEYGMHVGGATHFALLNHPAVYERCATGWRLDAARRGVVEHDPHQVADREHPDNLAALDQRHVPEAAVDHQHRGVLGGVVRPHRVGVPGHPVGHDRVVLNAGRDGAQHVALGEDPARSEPSITSTAPTSRSTMR